VVRVQIFKEKRVPNKKVLNAFGKNHSQYATKDNKLFTSAKKMNEVLKNFYEDLYMTTCSAGDKELFLPEGKATATVFRGKG